MSEYRADGFDAQPHIAADPWRLLIPWLTEEGA